jgi:aspartate aminotransferase-like enzyme
MDFQNFYSKLLAKKANKSKYIFTPGPSSMTWQNIATLSPAFGRNDKTYSKIESQVLQWLKSLSGQEEIVRLQGSSTLGIEIALENFVSGNVLILDSGFYSNRIFTMLTDRDDVKVTYLKYSNFLTVSGNFDWVIAAPTETSTAFFTPIQILRQTADRCNAKLFLDATASIGLEKGHELAHVICFSSCKGLFGLTGAAFIAYSTNALITPFSFSLALETHKERKTTGPYHAIQSLYLNIESHSRMVKSVYKNKEKMLEMHSSLLSHGIEHQPNLCTAVNGLISPLNKNVILYEPRIKNSFSVLCHLGEVHLGENAKAKILNKIKIESL